MVKTSTKSRYFCFTLNNYTEADVASLKVIECKYVVFGFEVGGQGTPHLQGYIGFTNPRSFDAVRKLYKWHIEVAQGSATQNFNYCTKDHEVYERGTRPSDSEAAGENEKNRWINAKRSAVEGKLDDIPPDMLIRHYNTFKKIRADYQPPLEPLEEASVYGLWLQGPPRTGKSHFARTNFEPLYLKDTNKWWDGYKDEPYVLIDELEPQHAFMSSWIKKWVDRWPFSAETKGSKALIRPKLIIVTSNYSIAEVFAGVPSWAAIEQRFLVRSFSTQDGRPVSQTPLQTFPLHHPALTQCMERLGFDQ